MFGLPNPWLIMGVIFAMLGVYGYGHHAGYIQKENEDAIAIAQTNTKLNKIKEEADVQLAKQKKQLNDKNSQLVSALSNGSLRLSVPLSASTEHSPVSSRNSEERAELDRQVSEALVAITNDGDKAIIDLNSCIDRYEQIRGSVSGNR